MKKYAWKPFVFFILLTQAVGVLAGILTKQGVENYRTVLKPALTPPDIVFPIVWTVLFLLMGIGVAIIWQSPPSKSRTYSLIVFTAQLLLNFAWSLIFFNLQAFGFAFFWLLLLWVFILLMIGLYWKTNKTAAWLQVPYLLWVTFAGYLNYMVWMLNR